MKKTLLLMGMTLVTHISVQAGDWRPCPGHRVSSDDSLHRQQVPVSPTEWGGPGMSAWDLQQMTLYAMAKEAALQAQQRPMEAIATGQDEQQPPQGASRSDAAERENA